MISNDNLFDISILHQVLEIGQFYQFSFNSQCQFLNRTSTGHWTRLWKTPLNLAKLFRSEVCRHTSKMNNKRYLLTQQKYHPRGAALINVHEIAIQVYPPPSLWVCKNKPKKFMYAMLVEVILPMNTINHQTILSLNSLTDE